MVNSRIEQRLEDVLRQSISATEKRLQEGIARTEKRLEEVLQECISGTEKRLQEGVARTEKRLQEGMKKRLRIQKGIKNRVQEGMARTEKRLEEGIAHVTAEMKEMRHIVMCHYILEHINKTQYGKRYRHYHPYMIQTICLFRFWFLIDDGDSNSGVDFVVANALCHMNDSVHRM